jgi:hypothetical protein
MHRSHRAPLAVALVAGLIAAPVARAADETEAAPTLATLSGKITTESVKGGTAGAVVVAYHLSSGNTARSPTTGPDGHYELAGLEHGYYDVGVETALGVFVVDQVINVPPSGKMVVNLQLATTAPGEPGPRDFPGSDKPPVGLASLAEKGNKKGVIWATSAGVAAALLLSAAGSSGGSSSPSTP